MAAKVAKQPVEQTRMNGMPDGFREIPTERVETKRLVMGDTVQGRLVDRKSLTNSYGESVLLVVELDYGERIGYWAPTSLRQAIRDEHVGRDVWFHCLGKVKNANGTEAWDFAVAVK